MRVVGLALAVCLTGSALAQGMPAARIRVTPQLSAEIAPLGQKYTACALQHIQRVATANPSSVFEQHEFSIRSPCGVHVDQIVLAFLRYGHTQDEANAWIRNAYDSFRPRLQRAFAATAAQKPQPPTPVPSDAQNSERNKVLRGTLDDIKACLT